MFILTSSPGIFETSLLAEAGVRLREHFAKESCGVVKGFPLGFSAPRKAIYIKRRREERGFPEIQVSRHRRRPQVESTEALVIQFTLPVRACWHAGKISAFGLTYYWI
ncbi:hypothetical protein KIW84_075040 [Lathyrus oleraceus]|uniref:Uncharacterized protein n=1 Tax=Pisum sativum TaxID=3888 RepID=A0A9D4VSY6_PEA|nr:hypothetical protein KIW84_075040 [Pisum sativum]